MLLNPNNSGWGLAAEGWPLAITQIDQCERGSLMVDILAKEAPSSPEEVTQFFMRVHDAKPGITERWLEEIKTEDGRSSYAMLCEAGEPLAGKTVVDLACGSGPLTVLLASRVGNSGRVIGVDLNINELRSAQVKFSSA